MRKILKKANNVYFDWNDGVLKETTTFNINLRYTNGYVAAIY